jgi:hypothetical protein
MQIAASQKRCVSRRARRIQQTPLAALVSASHTRIVLLYELDTKRFPSCENETELTILACPFNGPTTMSPVSASQTRIVWSYESETMRMPSCEIMQPSNSFVPLAVHCQVVMRRRLQAVDRAQPSPCRPRSFKAWARPQRFESLSRRKPGPSRGFEPKPSLHITNPERSLRQTSVGKRHGMTLDSKTTLRTSTRGQRPREAHQYVYPKIGFFRAQYRSFPSPE